MYVVAARPKVGKTTLMQEIARYTACRAAIPTLYLDNEMSREELYSRALSAETSLQEFQLLRGDFFAPGSEAIQKQVRDGITRLQTAPLYSYNVAGKPIEFITSVIRQFRNHIVGEIAIPDEKGQPHTVGNPGLVIFDWIKLPGGDQTGAKEYQLLGDLCSALKQAAARADLPIVAGAQNNRGATGKTGVDFVNEAENFVAGTDRIAQFCTMLCSLRNVSEQEEQEILAKWPDARPIDPKNDDIRQRLLFNQVLHIMLQRQGPDLRRGIPLHLNRGRAQYQECVYGANGASSLPAGHLQPRRGRGHRPILRATEPPGHHGTQTDRPSTAMIRASWSPPAWDRMETVV